VIINRNLYFCRREIEFIFSEISIIFFIKINGYIYTEKINIAVSSPSRKPRKYPACEKPTGINKQKESWLIYIVPLSIISEALDGGGSLRLIVKATGVRARLRRRTL
jgi:hypothetical protein